MIEHSNEVVIQGAYDDGDDNRRIEPLSCFQDQRNITKGLAVQKTCLTNSVGAEISSSDIGYRYNTYRNIHRFMSGTSIDFTVTLTDQYLMASTIYASLWDIEQEVNFYIYSVDTYNESIPLYTKKFTESSVAIISVGPGFPFYSSGNFESINIVHPWRTKYFIDFSGSAKGFVFRVDQKR